MPVTEVDNCMVAEANCLRPLSGRSHFGHHNPDDKSVDEAADDILYGDDDDSNHAVLRHSSEAITNGGLGFQRKEESGCEAVHLIYTRVFIVVFDVSMSQSNDEEEYPKKEPGKDVRRCKDQEHHPPSDLN